MDLYRTLDLISNPVNSSHFENKFKRTINSPSIRAITNESSKQRTDWLYHCYLTFTMRIFQLLLRNHRHRATRMPARMRANGNFSDASVERFYSVRINRMISPSDAVELGRPCNRLFELQVVQRCVFTVV